MFQRKRNELCENASFDSEFALAFEIQQFKVAFFVVFFKCQFFQGILRRNRLKLEKWVPVSQVYILKSKLLATESSETSYTKVCNPCNYPQPPKKSPTTIHNHPKITQKAKIYDKQLRCSTLDVNSKTGIDFDSDMKQWYIYICLCVSVCLYTL